MLRALVFDAYGTLFDPLSVRARCDMLEPLVAQSGLAFDAVLSVDAVKLYKLNRTGAPVERLGFAPDEILRGVGDLRR